MNKMLLQWTNNFDLSKKIVLYKLYKLFLFNQSIIFMQQMNWSIFI